MCPLHKVAAVLVWVGALNWGLVGAFDFNLVETIFGGASNIVYILVGISALLLLTCCKCKACMAAMKK
jgi:hypothetical protein